MNIKARQDQTIFDMTTQLYGSIDKIFDLLIDNDIDFNTNVEGVDLIYTKKDFSIVKYFRTNNINIVTSTKNEDDFREFDGSFQLSFS